MPLTKTPARKGMCTRSSEDAEHTSEDAVESMSVEALLRAAKDELRQLREERAQQQRQQEQLMTALRLRDEEVQRLQENRQISLSCNGDASNTRNIGGFSGERVALNLNELHDSARDHADGIRGNLGYKLKPDTYDGETSLRKFFLQFELIARANCWNDATKAVALATCLRGKARSVLECIQVENLEYGELKEKLELRFGEGNLSQNFYTQFTNRRQKFGESLATLSSEIEKLSRLAYPECSFAMRDKIACAQYITALTDGFIRRILQLEGVSSLNSAIERAKTIKIIQGESMDRKKGNYYYGKRKEEEEGRPPYKENKMENKEGECSKEKKKVKKGFSPRECWQCGKEGHFRSECPEYKGNAD